MEVGLVLGVKDKDELFCLIRALEVREEQMETMGDVPEAARCRTLLGQARRALGRMEVS